MADRRATEKLPGGIFTLVSGIRLLEAEKGGVILRLSPLKALRVNESAFQILKECQSGLSPEDCSEMRRSAGSFLDAMCSAQVLRWKPSEEMRPPQVSIVVPVYNRSGQLGECLESLLRLDYPRDRREIIVVDDASTDDTADVAGAYSGAIKLIVQEKNLGQSAARNAGALAAAGDILAFIDSDCIADRNWLKELTPYFEDPRIALVGGFVDSYFRATRLDRYEEKRSPLNMGAHMLICSAPHSDFYVPTCNMLVRKSAFLQADRLDESLRVGEDVDLCWKLKKLGHRLIYLPEGRVSHKHRNSFWPAFHRRFEYGTSEPVLYDRHREVIKRFPCRPAVLLFLFSCCLALIVEPLFFSFFSTTLIIALTLFNRAAIRKTAGIHLSFLDILRATLKNCHASAYFLTLHFVRYYVLLIVALTIFFPSADLLWLVLVLFPVAVEYFKVRPRLSFPLFAFFFLAEQVFYQAGVFYKSFEMRSLRCFRLSFGSRRKMERGSALGVLSAAIRRRSSIAVFWRQNQ